MRRAPARREQPHADAAKGEGVGRGFAGGAPEPVGVGDDQNARAALLDHQAHASRSDDAHALLGGYAYGRGSELRAGLPVEVLVRPAAGPIEGQGASRVFHQPVARVPQHGRIADFMPQLLETDVRCPLQFRRRGYQPRRSEGDSEVELLNSARPALLGPAIRAPQVLLPAQPIVLRFELRHTLEEPRAPNCAFKHPRCLALGAAMQQPCLVGRLDEVQRLVDARH